MSKADKAIDGIRAAAQRRDQAAIERREATDQLRRYCREAQAAGVPITQIAREARLSRQGAYDLLAERPGQ